MEHNFVNKIKSWTNTYYQELELAIGGAESVIDIGCGINSPVAHLSSRPRFLVGVDGFQPSIDESRKRSIHDEYVCSDLLNIDKAFEPGTFETAIALDVIEHFPKEKGLELMQKMEKLASKRVIIFTPNGFLPQDEHSGNPLQKHVSGWSVEEMRQYGYRVVGINGWKVLRGEFALIRFHPRSFWLIVSRLTQSVVRKHPKYAFALLCVKDL